MHYSIDHFWKPRLDGLEPTKIPILNGWESQHSPYSGFVEADLAHRAQFDDFSAPIWFVSAPGAVGKSTLARQIAAETSAIYLDLSAADTVAGNYLTGGLVNNEILEQWNDNRTTILVDALDEARMRVTQDSFEHFLQDVLKRSQNRIVPTILFGRVGIVDESWLILSEQGIECPILEIQLFNHDKAIFFVEKTLDRLAETPRYRDLKTALSNHRESYRKATERLVSEIDHATRNDTARFSGYAPVLEAAGTRIASETNPFRINEAIEHQMHKDVLRHLSEQIMEREGSKLRNQLPDDIDGNKKLELYTPTEQTARLVRIIYGSNTPPHYNAPVGYERQYDETVQRFISEHPFLDGTGTAAATSVFAAFLTSAALFDSDPETVRRAQHSVENRTTPANPFLIDFYLAEHATRNGSKREPIPAEHIVYLYESAESRQDSDQTIYLNVDGDDDSDTADAEIQISGTDSSEPVRIELTLELGAPIKFSTHLRSTFIDAPKLDLVVGDGNAVHITAPVLIDCRSISFDCPELDIYPSDPSSKDCIQSVVSLCAEQVNDSRVTKSPRPRGDVSFTALWEGAIAHPWTNFAAPPRPTPESEVDEYLRRLAKIIIAFRSHSKGSLARLRDKIDHQRISKGPGAAIRDKLIEDRVIYVRGRMYHLNPEMLGSIVGATFQDASTRSFNEKTVDYVRQIAEHKFRAQ